MDIGTVTAAMTAASAAIGLIDKISDQVEQVLTHRSVPSIPKEHRMKIEGNGTAIVSRLHGQVYQTITAQDLQRLPAYKLKHITVLEQSMQNYYNVWAAAYPELALEGDPIRKAQLNQRLTGIIANMKVDLNGILGFLELCGMQLDDHYQHIRQLVSQA